MAHEQHAGCFIDMMASAFKASTEVTQRCQALRACRARQVVKLRTVARVLNLPIATSLLRHTACKLASCKLPSPAALVTACKDRQLQSALKSLVTADYIEEKTTFKQSIQYQAGCQCIVPFVTAAYQVVGVNT